MHFNSSEIKILLLANEFCQLFQKETNGKFSWDFSKYL